MKKVLLIVLFIMFLMGCKDDIPAWKIKAYENGPIASGTVSKIDITTGYSAWSGDWCHYIIHLDTGAIIKLKEWEYRDARGLVVGDNVTIYHAWQSGYVIERQREDEKMK